MPQRSTNFQDLIELLERQLAPAGAKVTASKLLRDVRTGEDREVDIVIEVTSGIHPFKIGIEVSEHTRPASSTWIEAIAKKHEDLPIHKSIAVSRSGFYEPAMRKASAYKIDALTIKEASDLNWQAKIDRMPDVKIVSFLLPYLTNATVVFTDESSITQFSGGNLGMLELYKPSGERRGSLRTVICCLIQDDGFVRKLQERAYTDSGTITEGELSLEKGSYVLGPNDDKHEVHSIRFSARCRKEEMDAELVKGRYRDTAVVMASGSTFGKPLQMVFTEQQGEQSPKFTLRVKNTKEKQ